LLASAGPASAQDAAPPLDGSAAAASAPALADDSDAAAGAFLEETGLDARLPRPAPAARASDFDRAAAAVRRVWDSDAEDLAQRANRARRVALQHGIWNFDPAARALIGPELDGVGLDQAQAAVVLSPDLPAARMALAREIWLEGDSPIAAVRAAFSALLAIPRHFEASLWFSASLLYIAALALIAAGFLTIALHGVFALPHAAHDLGDGISSALPAFARGALIAALMLVPIALQQGWLGLGLGLFAVGSIYGGTRQRLVLCVAAAAVLLGLFPIARIAGSLLTAYVDTPTEAAILATDGLTLPGDVRQLDFAQEGDPLAAMALAVTARRAGDLAESDARYRRLLQQDPSNFNAANNAANVKLELGQVEQAIGLYQRSSELQDSATVRFNLSQAQGQAFKLDEVGPTLAVAQRLDPRRVAELTLLQGSDLTRFTIDFPLPRSMLWERILGGRIGEALSDELRAAIAPGVLGRTPQLAAGAFASLAVLSWLIASRTRKSRWCERCGRRMCPRCEPELGREADCESCNRLFNHPETTDREMRTLRVNALRFRERRLARIRLITSILVPGASGALSRCPGAAFIGALSGSIAILAIVWRNGVTPDPLMAGVAAPVAFGLVALVASLCYGAAVALPFSARNRS